MKSSALEFSVPSSQFSVSTGRFSLRTENRELRTISGARLSILPLTFLGTAEKLVDPALQFIGPIDLEIKFRRTPQTQALRKFVPDIILGSGEPFERPLGLGFIAGNADHNPSRTRVLSHKHGADTGQADARIAEFPFEDSFNLFADGLAQPSAMIFLATMLHGTPRMEENS
jgi:hypothetical protein